MPTNRTINTPPLIDLPPAIEPPGAPPDLIVGPIVYGVQPSSGSASGGQLTTITGANFVAGARVRFADSEVVPINVMPGQITLLTPARPAGPAAVQVRNPNGLTGLGPIYTFVAAAPPPSPPPQVPPPNPGSADVTLRVGESVTVGITFTRMDGRVEPLNVTTINLPAGATRVFDPATQKSNEAFRLTIGTSGCTPGSYPISVGAVGLETNTAYPPFTIRMTLLPVQDQIDLTAPSVARVQSGTTVEVPITVRRSFGTNRAVTLALAGTLPAGVTATFVPNPVPAASAVLRLNAVLGLPDSAVDVQVTGDAGGVRVNPANLRVEVEGLAGRLVVDPDRLNVASGGVAFLQVSLVGAPVAVTVGYLVTANPGSVLLEQIGTNLLTLTTPVRFRVRGFSVGACGVALLGTGAPVSGVVIPVNVFGRAKEPTFPEVDPPEE